MECATSLQNRFISTATASDKSDHGTALGGEGPLGPRWKPQTSNIFLLINRDNHSVVSRSARDLATVANLGLDVTHNSTLGDGAEGKDVPDIQGCLLASVHKLSTVHALWCTNQSVHFLVSVGILELNNSKRSSSA